MTIRQIHALITFSCYVIAIAVAFVIGGFLVGVGVFCAFIAIGGHVEMTTMDSVK